MRLRCRFMPKARTPLFTPGKVYDSRPHNGRPDLTVVEVLDDRGFARVVTPGRLTVAWTAPEPEKPYAPVVVEPAAYGLVFDEVPA